MNPDPKRRRVSAEDALTMWRQYPRRATLGFATGS